MKKLLAFLILIVSFISFHSIHAKAETIVEHPNLEEAIKFQLNIDEKVSITKTQLESLPYLEASWWGITDLSGLEFAKNIGSLYLEGNGLKDIDQLKELTQISHLYLTDNDIVDTSALGNFKNLSVLDLSQNQLSTVTSLSQIRFTSSGGLSLADNSLTDLTPLGKVAFPSNTGYFYIDVSKNQVTKLNGLEAAKGLTELSASDNNLTNIDSLRSLTKLDYVNLSNNDLSSLSSLGSSHIHSLLAANNKLTSLQGVTIKANESYYLDFENNQLTDISSLSSMTEGYINLKNNPLSYESRFIIQDLLDRGVTVIYDPITSKGSKRLFGEDRFKTAIAISNQGWSNGADTVIITRSDSFPDALAGAPLSYKLNAPILLTDSKTLTDATSEEIQRLKPTKIIVLGGRSGRFSYS
ncbi:leucine-rich repeat domain-containing protein [Bacillus carboniphilus]|uniref:Leucine-rich repeat domain-containing protein n=1 Tax=Bacillus carboniphilus TaxID=86663 RepID=A0ABY9JT55_9BACI|nr:leucine-rich repeat domain-containing protein [Bacillus carboniphilus]WLR41597.1 leucine-rich repeat domain-containing protein [Bacillus carboniphilus]